MSSTVVAIVLPCRSRIRRRVYWARALDQGDHAVDTREGRERPGLADVRDADPPVEVLWVGPTGCHDLPRDTATVAPGDDRELREPNDPQVVRTHDGDAPRVCWRAGLRGDRTGAGMTAR